MLVLHFPSSWGRALNSSEYPLERQFDLASTLISAQAFQWREFNGIWVGAVADTVVAIRQTPSSIIVEDYCADNWSPQEYFRMKDNLEDINQDIRNDPLIDTLLAAKADIALTSQDPWQCTLMFLCSTNNNAKRISNMVLSLNRMFGVAVETPYGQIYKFPSPRSLSSASVHQLETCGLGYRAKFVRDFASIVYQGALDFKDLKKANYKDAVAQLVELPGIGPKVADCISLLSLDKLEAFPMDIWIRRVVSRRYYRLLEKSDVRRLLDESKTVSTQLYRRVTLAMRSHFGRFAGYAQNTLYYNAKRLVSERTIAA